MNGPRAWQMTGPVKKVAILSAVRNLLLLAIGFWLLALGCAAPAAHASNYTTLAGMRLAQNTTLAAATILRMETGDVVNCNGFTLTINGPVEAPASQIFTNCPAGAVITNDAEARPEWWGASPAASGATNLAAIQAAYAAIAGVFNVYSPFVNPVRRLFLSAGVYQVSACNKLFELKNANSQGEIYGASGTTIECADNHTGEYVIYHQESVDGKVNGVRLHDLSFAGPGAISISNATDASPIVITTVTAHGLATGDTAVIQDVGGNTAANGSWTVTVTDSTHFSLNSSTGNAAYTSGGVLLPNISFFYFDTSAASGAPIFERVYVTGFLDAFDTSCTGGGGNGVWELHTITTRDIDGNVFKSNCGQATPINVDNSNIATGVGAGSVIFNFQGGAALGLTVTGGYLTNPAQNGTDQSFIINFGSNFNGAQGGVNLFGTHVELQSSHAQMINDNSWDARKQINFYGVDASVFNGASRPWISLNTKSSLTWIGGTAPLSSGSNNATITLNTKAGADTVNGGDSPPVFIAKGVDGLAHGLSIFTEQSCTSGPPPTGCSAVSLTSPDRPCVILEGDYFPGTSGGQPGIPPSEITGACSSLVESGITETNETPGNVTRTIDNLNVTTLTGPIFNNNDTPGTTPITGGFVEFGSAAIGAGGSVAVTLSVPFPSGHWHCTAVYDGNITSGGAVGVTESGTSSLTLYGSPTWTVDYICIGN